MTVGSAANSYNYDKGNQNLFQATAYNCNDTTKQRDHAITIVGWDDNYSRDHFAEGSKPSTDGAYIVLNSYGANAFENGYLYVSYEDFLVESELYVITNSKKIDYDGIYQSDFYGGIFSVNTPSSEGYIANIFNRDTSKEEILNTVGVTVPDYGAVEVYINTEGDLNLNALTKIGESNGMLEPGFHMIDVTPTELTTDTFAIVIKQKSLNNTFCFAIEAPVAGTAYEVVNSNQNSYILIDEKGWVNLIDTGIQGIDLSKSDVCIKAFTTSHQESKDEHIAVKNYKIDEQYIVKIPNHTTIKEFKEHIIADLEQNIYDKDVLITEEEALIKTGMKLQLSDGTEYTLIIRGDTNCDGEVTLTDLSKLVLHYNETEGFILEGAAEKAGDMNTDKKITLTDVSQLIVLYNAM